MANISRRNQGQRGETSLYRRGPFGTLQDAFDNMFDRLMTQWSGPYGSEPAGMAFWDFNVEQTDDEIIVHADMPGFEADEIEINVDQNVLTIQAQQRQQDQRMREFRSFFRTVTLPMGVDTENVKANYRNGVLEVHLPRREEAKPRRIQVQGEPGQQGRQVVTGQASHPSGITGQAGQAGTTGGPSRPTAGTSGPSTGVPSGSQGAPSAGGQGTPSTQGRNKP